MKTIASLMLLCSLLFASLQDLESFEANFQQTITDEKDQAVSYSGSIVAKKPRNAIWKYTSPIKKEIYINSYEVVVIEEDLEQVIIKKLDQNLDLLAILSSAKKIDSNSYKTTVNGVDFLITQSGELLESISYKDEFENRIKITFSNQKQNKSVDESIFVPSFSLEFDIIRE
ncbi:MAG: LolA-like outer membrane lipoprotein chaperone [Sulfuricurvum sp.]